MKGGCQVEAVAPALGRQAAPIGSERSITVPCERFRLCWLLSSGGLGFDCALHSAAVAELAQCAVPKFDPGFDTAAGDAQSPFPRIG